MTILFWVLVFRFMYLVSVYPTNRTQVTVFLVCLFYYRLFAMNRVVINTEILFTNNLPIHTTFTKEQLICLILISNLVILRKILD